MLQTRLHYFMENPSTPGGNFRCISVSQERELAHLAAKYQRLPHIFGHGRLTGTIDSTLCDVGRQPEIAMAGYTNGINMK